MRVAVITGVSRGLGAALLPLALERLDAVVALGRDLPPLDPADRQPAFVRVDLADGPPDAATLDRALPPETGEIVFFDNAALLAGGPLVTATAPLAEAVAVNLTSPAALAAMLVRLARARGARLKIIHIGSGAARRPIAGWGAYCTTKAAAAMFYDILALEHPEVSIMRVDPGAMDSGMQADVRALDPGEAPETEAFRRLWAEGRLASPADVALRLFAEAGL